MGLFSEQTFAQDGEKDICHYEKPQLMELAVCDGVVRGATGYDMGGGTQGGNGNYNWDGEEATTEE